MSRKDFHRLPTNCVPSHYLVSITPDFKTFTFEGEEEISVEIKTECQTIVMNASGLNISKIELQLGGGINRTSSSFLLNQEDELLSVTFDPPLQPGKGTLKFFYSGTLNDRMKGFYRTKSKNQNGEEIYNAITQFQATDARMAFVCWDEPAIKCTFDIILTVPKDFTALSNMPVKSSSVWGEEKVVQFERTPLMSTYLVAWAVGEYDFVEGSSSDGIVCRVYTPPGKKDHGMFAIGVATKVLTFYKDYFGIAYPLPKLDLIAVTDLSFGAMENWGLVTYRETCLLVDEKSTTSGAKQNIALVICHEIAHMWFGNLVTLDWWSHLWLNEGYASFMEYFAVNHLFPEFDMWTQFVVDSHLCAMQLDCLKNSHAIEVEVGHPSEVEEIFDDISYNKGSAIIRMLHNYIGDDDFRKGMNIYLARHQYKNSVTEDLWKALEEASSKPIGAVMRTWTKEMGFPLISVSDVKQEGNSKYFTVRQKKFWADPRLNECNNAEEYSWLVPLTFSSSAEPSKSVHKLLLDTESAEIHIQNVDSNCWIKVNPGTVGFYRVQYSTDILEGFLPSIRNGTMPSLDRVGLLNDVFALVQAAQSPTTDVLKLLSSFVDEESFTVWVSITDIITKLTLLVEGTECFELFKSFVRTLYSKIFGKLGWEAKAKEDHLQTMLRSVVLDSMIRFGDETVIKEGVVKFKSGDDLTPDLKSAVYKSACSTNSEENLTKLINIFKASSAHEEQDRIGRCMGIFKDENILQEVLNFSISEDVRNQTTVVIVVSMALHSKVGRELAWEFFKRNWELFHKRYTGTHIVARMVKNLLQNFITEDKAADIEQFFKNNPFPGTERSIEQAVEAIRLQAGWVKRDFQLVKKFLENESIIS